MGREKLSVTIITLNEERRIEKCIESVSFADEVVVVDSGSSDRTVEIAEKLGAKVIYQEWLGYGRQKQFAVDQAANEWVLCLDADEWLSPELTRSIQKVLEQTGYSAYQFPRRNRFMGRWLRYGEGYPDWSLRLFNRNHANWSEDEIHEKVVPNGEVGEIREDLMHESEETLQQYLQKQNQYTTLQAQRLRDDEKSGLAIKMVLSPLFRFIKFYFVRLGVLDGVPGLVHILIGCRNSFMKYAKARSHPLESRC